MSIKSLVKSAFRRFGFDVVRYLPDSYSTLDIMPMVMKSLIKDRLEVNPDFFFVQVGANDGVSADPIRESILAYHLAGLLIEPLPDIFAKLRENYNSEPQLRFENVAISTQDGRLPFYRVKSGAPLGPWFLGMSSLDRKQLIKEKVDERYIEEVFIVAATFRTLLDKHGIERVDLLQVDVEGYDYQVVKSMLDLGIRPEIINYEHCHLDGLTRFECKRMLFSHGYQTEEIGIDTLAIRSVDSRRPSGASVEADGIG